MNEIDFFGFGANRDADMMNAIIGRKPKGYAATVNGFELCIQSFRDLPKQAQQVLEGGWGKHFQSYVLRPARTFKPLSVSGIVWRITQKERMLIDNWELTGIWQHIVRLQFAVSHDRDVQIEIQTIDERDPVTWIVSGNRYRSFLNDKQMMFDIASRVRRNFRTH